MRRWTVKELETIREYRAAGMPRSDIAKIMGSSEEEIRRAVMSAGMKIQAYKSMQNAGRRRKPDPKALPQSKEALRKMIEDAARVKGVTVLAPAAVAPTTANVAQARQQFTGDRSTD